MALNDFFSVDPNGTGTRTRRYDVQTGATTILPGEPVIQDPANPSFVIAAPDGASNTSEWIGVAATTSTASATADGEVYVIDDPMVVYRANALVPANLVQTMVNTKVVVNLTAGAYTVDESDVTNGVLTVKAIDTANGTVDFRISKSATLDN